MQARVELSGVALGRDMVNDMPDAEQ
jgi:hypothetical protein